MRAAARAWLPAAGVALLLGGCGQKGPLYLPDKGGKVVTSSPPAAAPAEPAPAATPATAPSPRPADKDKDQDQAPPPKP